MNNGNIVEITNLKKGYDKGLPDKQLVAAPINSAEGQWYLKAMAAAANFAFNQLRSKEGYDMYKDTPLEEKVEDMRNVVEAYDDLQDEIKEWDSTLMDGLDDEKNDWEIVDEEPQIEVKMSGEPSLNDIQEEIRPEEKLLNNPGISAWRKKKIQDYLNGKTNLFDYFVGQVMKQTRGKANPVKTKEILSEELNK